MPFSERSLANGVAFSDAPGFAQLALEAGRMGIWKFDVSKGDIHGDPIAANLMGFAPGTTHWNRASILKDMHPEDIPAINASMQAAMEREDGYEIEYRLNIPDPHSGQDHVRWLRNRARVTKRDEDGRASEFIGVCWDITADKERDQAMVEIAGDMDHRSKNAFAVIRAMINLGKRTSGSIEHFANTLRSQVEAIAGGHTLAAEISRKTQIPRAAVPIIELIEASLKPWTLARPTDTLSITIEGDPLRMIGAEAVVSMSMLLCEMASNSSRNGCLGPAGGQLRVTVEVSKETELNICWDETFNTPQNEPNPSGEEFGTILMSHCIATLKGEISREVQPDGFKARIQLPT